MTHAVSVRASQNSSRSSKSSYRWRESRIGRHPGNRRSSTGGPTGWRSGRTAVAGVSHFGTCVSGASDGLLAVRPIPSTCFHYTHLEHGPRERPRSNAGRLSFGAGWIVLVVGKLILFGGWTGFGLLFLGVLLDRLKAMKTDRYREVEK